MMLDSVKPRGASPDPHWDIAGRLMASKSIEPEDHVILQENLATYLAQMEPRFVDSLQEERTVDATVIRRGFAHGDRRWTEKVLRDVEAPYTDAQVFERARALDAELSSRVTDMLGRLPAEMPSRLYVIGSLVKGRFGANSDVDAMSDAPSHVLGAYPRSDVHIMATGNGSPRLEAFGEHVAYDARALRGDEVQMLLADGLAARGYVVEDGRVRHSGPPAARTREVAPKEAGTVIWSFSDLPV